MAAVAAVVAVTLVGGGAGLVMVEEVLLVRGTEAVMAAVAAVVEWLMEAVQDLVVLEETDM